MDTSDMLIVVLGVVSALVCVMCCAARFGLSRQAIMAEREQFEPDQRDAEDIAA
jgi:hypothetical protein